MIQPQIDLFVGKTGVESFDQRHAPVTATGTADGYGQVTLALFPVVGYQKRQQLIEVYQKIFAGRLAEDEFT